MTPYFLQISVVWKNALPGLKNFAVPIYAFIWHLLAMQGKFIILSQPEVNLFLFFQIVNRGHSFYGGKSEHRVTGTHI